MSILSKFLTLKWNISRTIWRIEVGDGSFLAFLTLLHLSFRPEFLNDYALHFLFKLVSAQELQNKS